MVYLILNIVFASSFTLFIKWVQTRQREDMLTVGMINYVVGAALTFPEFYAAGVSGPDATAMLTGGSMGACYFIAFFFVTYAIRKVGASAATVVGSLSILMPIGFGVLIWSEKPNIFQAFGIVLAVLSLTLVSGNRQDRPKSAFPDAESPRGWVTPAILATFFLLAGFSRIAQETFKHESHTNHRPTFLFTAFVVAAIPAAIILIARRRMPTRLEFAFGCGMGVSNILQTHFILKSLHHFPGYIVFLVSSAGGVMLTVLVATCVLGERLHRKTCWGIGIAVMALILLNWLPGESL
ncbi:MAG: DMT family transporter [Planctomycetota bacterium]|nr:DMT family transporter [Planctomycetota bacterium]